MRRKFIRALLVLVPALVLASCNRHWDVTGPNDGFYVHVTVANDSTGSIWGPFSRSGEHTELRPGSSRELPYIYRESQTGAFEVARPEFQTLAIVHFRVVRHTGRRTEFDYATIHVTANPPAPVTALSDRTDLVEVTSVTQGAHP
jgi:hypothetical protein